MSKYILILKPLYNAMISIMADTVTDTTSCGTAGSAVSEIENKHHLEENDNQLINN